jgi:hypothetical protein
MQLNYSQLCFYCQLEKLVRYFIVKSENNLDIAVIFGSDKTNHITSDEFFFFIDCLFRGMSKCLICKGESKPTNLNRRLSD